MLMFGAQKASAWSVWLALMFAKALPSVPIVVATAAQSCGSNDAAMPIHAGKAVGHNCSDKHTVITPCSASWKWIVPISRRAMPGFALALIIAAFSSIVIAAMSACALSVLVLISSHHGDDDCLPAQGLCQPHAPGEGLGGAGGPEMKRLLLLTVI